MEIVNRKAKYNYQIFETIEAGIVLTGTEIKSLKMGKANIKDSYARIKNNGDYHTDEHIIVCLSSSPSNPKIIRTAARMSNAFKCALTALFVETPNFSEMNGENQKRLRSNMRLAEQLGAQIETVYGEDVSFQIAEFARLSGASKIVLGRSSVAKHRLFAGFLHHGARGGAPGPGD